jgi:hypothetical protein
MLWYGTVSYSTPWFEKSKSVRGRLSENVDRSAMRHLKRSPVVAQANLDAASSQLKAYIHNASYLGSLLGLVVALLLVRPEQQTQCDPTSDGGD